MKKNSVINITGRRCRPEDEAQTLKWYSYTHQVELMKYEGLKTSTLLKVLKPDGKSPDILLIGEFNDEKGYDGYEAFRKATTFTSFSIKNEMSWRTQFKVIDVWER